MPVQQTLARALTVASLEMVLCLTDMILPVQAQCNVNTYLAYLTGTYCMEVAYSHAGLWTPLTSAYWA